MRRAGGWVLGVIAIAAMAAGGWVAFRPILKRETITLDVNTAASDPTTNALVSGMSFALDQAGGKAGGYRVVLEQDSSKLSLHPYTPLNITLGTSSVVRATLYVDDPKTGVVESLVVLRVHPSLKELGRASAGWVREMKPGRIALVREQDLDTGENDFIEAFRAASSDLPVTIVEGSNPMNPQNHAMDRVLAAKPDLVLYYDETAPYGQSLDFFEGLRKKGYRGLFAMADSDPGVSYLAIPTKVLDGTFLLSTIEPPPKEFAAAYEPATGRLAGPHAWPGYLLMNEVLDLFDRSQSTKAADLNAALLAKPASVRPCALYQFREGKFVFVRDLK